MNTERARAMRFTTYHPASRRAAAYEDGLPVEADVADVSELVALYMHYHFQSGLDEPEMHDGAVKFGKRIRVLARNVVESKQRLFDICADGTIVNPNEVHVSPETGMPIPKKER